MIDDVRELADAYMRLRAVLPSNWPQVRITLRRKDGQVLCTVERVSRTGRTEAEAIDAVASVFEQQRAERRRVK